MGNGALLPLLPSEASVTISGYGGGPTLDNHRCDQFWGRAVIGSRFGAKIYGTICIFCRRKFEHDVPQTEEDVLKEVERKVIQDRIGRLKRLVDR